MRSHPSQILSQNPSLNFSLLGAPGWRQERRRLRMLEAGWGCAERQRLECVLQPEGIDGHRGRSRVPLAKPSQERQSTDSERPA